MKLVELVGLHVEATSGEPLVLLREHDAPHRVLPIFIGAPEAASIGVALSGAAPSRPLAHDVMAALVRSLDARLDAVEVVDVRDGSFNAQLALSGPTGEQRLESRPSDAIALAVRLDVPLFVSDEVLEEAGTVVAEEIDEEEIDDAVAEFRSFLDEVDPSDFEGEPLGEPPAPAVEVTDAGDPLGDRHTDTTDTETHDARPHGDDSSGENDSGSDRHHPGR